MSWFEEWVETNLKAAGQAFVKVLVDASFQRGVDALIERDYPTAFELFEASAQFHPIAQYHMGCMLFSGKGTSKNYLKAVQYFAASSVCVPQAVYALATIYRDGAVGVSEDKQESLKWFNIVGSRDDEFAAKDRDALEENLSEEEMLAAQQASEQWISDNPMWDQWILWTTAEQELMFNS